MDFLSYVISETAVVEKEKESVEKEVEDVDTPKVADVEESADLPNGNGKENTPAAVDATDNGTTEKAVEEEPSKELEEEKKENNGDSTGNIKLIKKKNPSKK